MLLLLLLLLWLGALHSDTSSRAADSAAVSGARTE